jgi:hypothetical protein
VPAFAGHARSEVDGGQHRHTRFVEQALAEVFRIPGADHCVRDWHQRYAGKTPVASIASHQDMVFLDAAGFGDLAAGGRALVVDAEIHKLPQSVAGESREAHWASTCDRGFIRCICDIDYHGI